MEEDEDFRDHQNRFNDVINRLNKWKMRTKLLFCFCLYQISIVPLLLLIGWETKLSLDENIIVLLEAERLMR